MPTHPDHHFDYDEFDVPPEHNPTVARIVMCAILAASIAATIITVVIVVQRTQ